MKKLLKHLALFTSFTLLSLFLLSSCDITVVPHDSGSSSESESEAESEGTVQYSLYLAADKTAVKRGDTVTLTAVLRAEGEEDIPSEDTEYTIISGGSYVSIDGNVLTVLATAPDGAVVTVQAKEGVSNSNTVALTVSVPVDSISISAGNVENILAGSTLTLTKTVLPVGAPTSVSWTVTEGEDIASVVDGVLSINANAATGATVKVIATAGEKESNELTFTVGYPLDTLVASHNGGANVLPGAEVILSVTKKPANTTNGDYTWEFISGEDAVVLDGDKLTVKNDPALTGTVVELMAVSGAKESNKISFTVGYELETLLVSYAGGRNVLPGTKNPIAVSLAPANATDGDYTWEVIAGAEAVTVSGSDLTVKADAIVGTVVRVKAVTTKAAEKISSDVIEFTVGIAPESITVTHTIGKNLNIGETAFFGIKVLPENATNKNYHFEFTSGENAVIYTDNFLTVKNNPALTCTVVSFKVVIDGVAEPVSSDEISFVVGYPLESITVTNEGNANLPLEGEFTLPTPTLTPANTTNGTYKWEIVEGAVFATVNGDKLVIADTAKTGDTVKIKAVAATRESDVLTYVVGYPLEKIEVNLSGATYMLPGTSAELLATVSPANTTNGAYEWEIVEGADFATISGNIITVNEGVALDSEIKVQAVALETDYRSEALTIVVNTPLTDISISVDAPEILDRGARYPITISALPENASLAGIRWSFTEGGDYATVEGNELVIKENFPAGARVTFYATSGDIQSEPISLTVGVALTDIEISLEGDVESIEPGESCNILATLTPSNASDTAITWVIDDGADYATVANGVITVKNDLKNVGKTVTFHAECGGKASEPITVTVGVAVTDIILNFNEEYVNPGESRVIGCTVTPDNSTLKNVEWVITEGKSYATIVNGVLTTNNNAENIGKTVTFYAKVGDKTSDPITVTVGVPVDSVTITLADKNVNPGESRVIGCTVTPDNSTLKNVEWVITEGKSYATIVNGVLTMNNSTQNIGKKVTFYAKVGDKTSDPITVTVGIPVDSVTISAIGSTDIVKGNTVSLSAKLGPTGATVMSFTWVIVEGENCEIIDNTLVVSSKAVTGAKIVVKAVADGIESDPLEFTVMATQEELQQNRYIIQLSADKITVDKKGGSATPLTVKVYNGLFQQVTNVPVTFRIVSGGEYASLTQSGYRCDFTAIGHGEVTVEAELEGYGVTATATVSVIVPPDAVDIPEVFGERPNFEYNFSLIDPRTNTPEKLPFVASARGASLACKDLVYSFAHEDGTTGDAVAVYENGEIVFKKTGKVTVTVTSDSGSRVEASSSYVFRINEGYNANDYVELQRIVESDYYNGQVINVVVLTKPDGSATNYEYGYDLVPPTALRPWSEQTVERILRSEENTSGLGTPNRIQAVNKSLYLNGNGHKLDASQMRPFTKEEYLIYAEKYGITDITPYIGSLFSVETWTSDTVPEPGPKDAFRINVYDFAVKGNCPVDYSLNFNEENGYKEGTYIGGKDVYGCYTLGMVFGTYGCNGQFYVDANNIRVEGFKEGLMLQSIVGNGKVSNVYAGNCYATGIMTHSSIVTLENMTFGPCGATGIEMGGAKGTEAGINNDQNSEVTLSGTVNASANKNNGNTIYFQNYLLAGATIPTVINMNVLERPDHQVSHIRQNGDYIFVALVLKDLATFEDNPTNIIYPAFQSGGIINIDQLLDPNVVDTTHEYIEMTIMAPVGPGGANVEVGKALFYNHNYKG